MRLPVNQSLFPTGLLGTLNAVLELAYTLFYTPFKIRGIEKPLSLNTGWSR
jgi:hypothetical protein